MADLDKDGQAEVLWGGYTLDGRERRQRVRFAGRDRRAAARLWPGIVVADLDHNGTLEVVTASGNGKLSVYGPGARPLSGWPQDPTGTGNELRSLAVADLDNNGDLEIAVCSTRSDNQWFVYEHTGALRAGWPKMTDSDTNGYAAGCFNENVGVADIDDDGRGEIIGPNDTHYVAAFHDDGSPLRANTHLRHSRRPEQTVGARGPARRSRGRSARLCQLRRGTSAQHGEQRADHRRCERRRHTRNHHRRQRLQLRHRSLHRSLRDALHPQRRSHPLERCANDWTVIPRPMPTPRR